MGRERTRTEREEAESPVSPQLPSADRPDPDRPDFEDITPDSPLETDEGGRLSRTTLEISNDLQDRACSADVSEFFLDGDLGPLVGLKGIEDLLKESLPDVCKEMIEGLEISADPGERTSDWMYKDLQKLLECGGEFAPTEVSRDALAGASDFVRNYIELRAKNREQNLIGTDKYYHCLANCEATSRGVGGWEAAVVISTGREVVDVLKNTLSKEAREKGMTLKAAIRDSLSDMRANLDGQIGALRGDRCSNACLEHRPRGLK